MSLIKKVDQQSFKQNVLDRDGLVLVDFYADWCGPCTIQAPILEAVSTELVVSGAHGAVNVVKVDVDSSRGLSQDFAVRSIPTLILFQGGKPVASHVGVADKKAIMGLLKQAA